MTDAIIETAEDVRASQQDMIRTLEQAGLKRKNIAAHLEIDVSYLNHIMSDSMFTAGARVDRALFRLTAIIDQDQHIEALLPPNKHVATSPDVKTTNGCYLDEWRDSVELTGKISEIERQKDHPRIRSYWRHLKAVATRGEMEAAAALRFGSHGLGG